MINIENIKRMLYTELRFLSKDDRFIKVYDSSKRIEIFIDEELETILILLYEGDNELIYTYSEIPTEEELREFIQAYESSL